VKESVVLDQTTNIHPTQQRDLLIGDGALLEKKKGQEGVLCARQEWRRTIRKTTNKKNNNKNTSLPLSLL
jgi:hypothetical protein